MPRDDHPFDFVQEIRVERDPGWLGATLTAAARGRFPDADRTVRLAPPPIGARAAVVAFTAHHVVASNLDPDDVARRLRTEGIQLPTDPRFLAWFSERAGGSSEDTIDVVLARQGSEPNFRSPHGRTRRGGAQRSARMLDLALACAGPTESVYAQISAGNSAALRAALRTGFRPICAEYLIR